MEGWQQARNGVLIPAIRWPERNHPMGATPCWHPIWARGLEHWYHGTLHPVALRTPLTAIAGHHGLLRATGWAPYGAKGAGNSPQMAWD